MSEQFLTEATLVEFLKENVDPEGIHNRKFLEYNFRPDYVSHNLKMVVEFDGYLHYTKSRTVLKDREKNSTIQNCGYKIIRIPYFIQLDKKVMDFLFNDYIQTSFDFSSYPHGFIDEKAVLPADFCYLGIERFLADLEIYHFISGDIYLSLENKIAEGAERLCVYWQ